MLICPKCSSTSDEGKFCYLCGCELIEAENTQPLPTPEDAVSEEVIPSPDGVEEPSVVEEVITAEESAIAEEPPVVEEPTFVEEPTVAEEPTVVEMPVIAKGFYTEHLPSTDDFLEPALSLSSVASYTKPVEDTTSFFTPVKQNSLAKKEVPSEVPTMIEEPKRKTKKFHKIRKGIIVFYAVLALVSVAIGGVGGFLSAKGKLDKLLPFAQEDGEVQFHWSTPKNAQDKEIPPLEDLGTSIEAPVETTDETSEVGEEL